MENGDIRNYFGKAAPAAAFSPNTSDGRKPPAVKKLQRNNQVSAVSVPHSVIATGKNKCGVSITKPVTSLVASYPSTTPDVMSWLQKYAPTEVRQILSNKDKATMLTNWLQRWNKNFKEKDGADAPEGCEWKKAALLSGHSGVGKTATATIVANKNGWHVINYNLLDDTAKSAMRDDFASYIDHYSSVNFVTHVLILRKISTLDHGELSEVFKMIHQSTVPVILICRERSTQAAKSLAPYCFDIRFRKPDKFAVAKRATEVANLEGVILDKDSMESFVELCLYDIGKVLNSLQKWARHGNIQTPLPVNNEMLHALLSKD